MKRNYLKFIPLLLVFALIAGCGGKKKVEDIGETATSKQGSQADKNPVVVPEEKPVGEAVTSQDLGTSASKEGTPKYASIGPGDGLTKIAQENGELYTVHFDFDKYNIRDEDRKLLTINAKWLSLNQNVKIRIEGYADERGETEYNLALGDKRARSVEQYLEDLGISKDRLSTISYGEENPVDKGHDEVAWSKNRRAEFKIVK